MAKGKKSKKGNITKKRNINKKSNINKTSNISKTSSISKTSNNEGKDNWALAEAAYENLHVSIAMPFLRKMSSADIVEELDNITKKCSTFYPAFFELGIYLMSMGNETLGQEKIEHAFQNLLKTTDSKKALEAVDALYDNLAQIYRYDISYRYFRMVVEKYPDAAQIYDNIAHSAAMLGYKEEAMTAIERAIQIKPKSHLFVSNLGWFNIIFGNLKEAEEALLRAKQLKPTDKIIKGNIKVLDYLKERGGGTYFDYLIRPIDYDELERIENDDEDEYEDNEMLKLCQQYNHCRLEAMAMEELQKETPNISLLYDKLSTLKHLFGFIENIIDDYFLFDDISFMETNFEKIMHIFIVKFKDIDNELLNCIYRDTLDFYSFLKENNLIDASSYTDYKTEIMDLKKELMDKIKRYNAIRHDSTISDSEKEDIRYELFAGDHEWPYFLSKSW